MIKTFVLAVALALGAHAHAQTASSPAKKELVDKILAAQQGAVEALARQIVERPAVQLLQRAGQVVQARVAADQRETVARELQEDARRYFDETYPFVRERAIRLAPTTIGPVMESKLTEDELRQVLAVFESPAWRKYQGLGGEMQQALGQALVGEVREHLETRVRALDQAMARRVGIDTGGASGAASAPGR
jgi:uncharacterized protein